MLKRMKNIEMVNAVNALNGFVAKDKVVPVTLSVAITANIKNLLRELEPYEEERKKILKVQKNPQESDVKDSLFKELCNIEVDVNLRLISPTLLDGLQLSTKDYMALEFMLEEKKDESKEPESRSE